VPSVLQPVDAKGEPSVRSEFVFGLWLERPLTTSARGTEY